MTGSAQQDTGIPLGGWVAEGNRGKNCTSHQIVVLKPWYSYTKQLLYIQSQDLVESRISVEKNIKQTIQNRAISSSQQVNYEVKITPKTAMGQIKKRKIKSCKIEIFCKFYRIG